MKSTGIVRRIDDLGRIVIPKEIRRTLRIREGDPLEIYTDNTGNIIFKKYSFIKEKDSFILLINSSQIKDLEKNEWIYIDRKKYHYQIKSVDDNYSNINNEIFETVHVNLNNYKTNAVLTDGYLLKSKKNLYQMVIDFIKGDIT